MSTKVKVFAICFIAACALSTGAEGINGAQKRDKLTGQYSGGGIRGARQPSPEVWLVSADEAIRFKGEDGFNEPPALRPRAAVPQIDILKPDPVTDLKVKAPFAIEVLFKSQADAAIDPTTFKVLYGAFKLDITSRITQYVKVSKDGFTLDNAKIPPGKHRLTLQVQDQLQRLAQRELRLEVE